LKKSKPILISLFSNMDLYVCCVSQNQKDIWKHARHDHYGIYFSILEEKSVQ
jgi:hypothetical protein